MYKSNMLDFSSLFLLIFLLAEELAFKINLADQNFNVAFFCMVQNITANFLDSN